MQFNNRKDIIQITPLWKGERFPDGRPKVPDKVLDRLRGMSIEEVWQIPWTRLNNFQFQGGFKCTHSSAKPTVGRAVTASFVPIREDLEVAMRCQAKAQGMKGAYNQWVIDSLVENDVFVADLFDKIEYGTIVGGNLSSAIKKRTIRGGAVIWGSIRDVQQIRNIEGINVFYRGFHPTPIRDICLVGFNAPCKIGCATCLPGDVVYACDCGVYFIPPHLAEEVANDGEKTKVKDIFSFQRLHEGRYTATAVDQVWTPEMFEDFMDWIKNDEKAKPYRHLSWENERKSIFEGIDAVQERYAVDSLSMKKIEEMS